MTRVLLHIGTPKTGSTSFQGWASASRALLERETNTRLYRGLFEDNHYEFGLLCKRSSRNGFGELEFPDWCLPEWRSEAQRHIRGEVDSARAAGQDLLVSSEVLSLLRHDDELRRLKGLLGGLEVRAVAVVRKPDSFLESWRRQVGPGGWSAHRSSAGYTEPDSWLANYPAMTKAFDQAFGTGALELVSYEEALERRGTVIPAIVEALDLGPAASAWTSEAEWMNASGTKPAAAMPSSIAALRPECSRLNRRLDLLRQERDGLETQLDLRSEEVRRQEELVADLERELRKAANELETVKLEAERSSLTVAAMNASTSWRLTRPGRTAKRMVRRTWSGRNAFLGQLPLRVGAALGLATGACALLLLV